MKLLFIVLKKQNFRSYKLETVKDCVRELERRKIVEETVQMKKMRPKHKCDICDLWVNGNNMSNQRKQHSPPTIKCEKCDFLAHYKSQVDYHYHRKHVHQIKQGRPKGNRVESIHVMKPNTYANTMAGAIAASANSNTLNSNSAVSATNSRTVEYVAPSQVHQLLPTVQVQFNASSSFSILFISFHFYCFFLPSFFS